MDTFSLFTFSMIFAETKAGSLITSSLSFFSVVYLVSAGATFERPCRMLVLIYLSTTPHSRFEDFQSRWSRVNSLLALLEMRAIHVEMFSKLLERISFEALYLLFSCTDSFLRERQITKAPRSRRRSGSQGYCHCPNRTPH